MYNEYKAKLDKTLEDYMAQPINPRTVEYITGMLCLRDKLCDDCPDFNMDDWHFVNADGTEGKHWTIAETEAYNSGYDPKKWNFTMNMMYSDYCRVAERYGVGVPDFYAELSRAFLDDADAVKDKLECYYKYVVAHK